MKKMVCVYVEEETWKQFLQFLLNKHGKIRGRIGEAVTEALRLYIQQQ